VVGLLSAPREFVRGMAYVPRGFQVIREHRELWLYVVSQVAISALLLIAGPWIALGQSERITQAIWTPTLGTDLASRLLAGLHAGLGFVVALALIAVGVLAAATLGAALASPINDLLSERVEVLVTQAPGADPPARAILEYCTSARLPGGHRRGRVDRLAATGRRPCGSGRRFCDPHTCLSQSRSGGLCRSAPRLDRDAETAPPS
jgi:hypothetical protein